MVASTRPLRTQISKSPENFRGSLLVVLVILGCWCMRTQSTVIKYLRLSIRNMASDTRPPKVREKVALKPGFHLMDWMRLARSATDLAGLKGKPLKQVTLEELGRHNTKLDMWTAYKGKVYNLTPYIPYHPGGEEILNEAAGKDCTELVVQYHRWVNVESMIGKCLIGVLVDDTAESNPTEQKTTQPQPPADKKLNSVSTLLASDDV
ncbi:cytochrome b5 domain-containing protein [archaeon]|nr:MAG: cytochrome b5 domain-containing protein [archaeon]